VSALPWLGHIVVTGRDRLSFLEEASAARFSSRISGEVFPAAFTTPAGTPVAVAQAELSRDAVRLEVRTDRVEPLLRHLRAQVGDADVDLAPTAAWLVFTVLGPQAPSVLGEVSGLPAETFSGLPRGRWGSLTLGGVEARVRVGERGPSSGGAAFDVTVGAADGVSTWDALVRGGAKALGAKALEVLRVEAGRAELVVDLPLDRPATEAPSMGRAIDPTKPQFMGREALVAGDALRPTARVIVGLALETPSGTPPAAEGQPLHPVPDPADAQHAQPPVVGRLGTVVTSPTRGPIALALVEHERAAPGTRLALPSGALAEVCALPWSG